MAGGGPHQPPGVVVDHHRQVPVAPLVRHLIDADPPQPGQAVPAGLGVGDNTGDDAPDRRPGHPQQLTDRLLGGVDRQPGGGVVERAGVPGPMARPGHGGHHHPVLGAADPRRPGLQIGADHAQVQRPPAPPALALVEAGAAPATPTPAAPDPLRGRTDTTSVCSSWSKQTRSTTACSTPSSLAHSLADRTPFPFFRIQPSESRNRRRAAACSHIRPSRHPRIGEKSPFSGVGADRRRAVWSRSVPGRPFSSTGPISVNLTGPIPRVASYRSCSTGEFVRGQLVERAVLWGLIAGDLLAGCAWAARAPTPPFPTHDVC
jgi:hypothetical protein